MVFCNSNQRDFQISKRVVTILILIDGFLQFVHKKTRLNPIIVTILILIDGFLQSDVLDGESFIDGIVTILILIDGFLQ